MNQSRRTHKLDLVVRPPNANKLIVPRTLNFGTVNSSTASVAKSKSFKSFEVKARAQRRSDPLRCPSKLLISSEPAPFQRHTQTCPFDTSPLSGHANLSVAVFLAEPLVDLRPHLVPRPRMAFSRPLYYQGRLVERG
ncbi:hypothetical protein BaRGS_00018022 [Batillaria attramentaria]|uniref:Uncharacterized protein n=1 Tax=Batillaria attramentaria TaxID=370345 RepID=A0ABD0KU44_9CAEN